MSGIGGIGGVGPVPERSADVRSREREPVTTPPPRDGVAISPDAQRAAEAARVQQATSDQEDVRPERVQQAREAIERGDYQDETVLRQVAQRLLKLLE